MTKIITNALTTPGPEISVCDYIYDGESKPDTRDRVIEYMTRTSGPVDEIYYAWVHNGLSNSKIIYWSKTHGKVISMSEVFDINWVYYELWETEIIGKSVN